MRDQSRWMGVGLIAVGLLVALGCWHFNHGGSRADAAAGSAISVSATQDDSLLQKLGIKLENPGVENKAPLNLVPQGRAVQNAKWAYPKVAKTASSISCVYRLISKPDFSSFSPEALAANPVLRETRKLMRTPRLRRELCKRCGKRRLRHRSGSFREFRCWRPGDECCRGRDDGSYSAVVQLLKWHGCSR
ncbi:hypothetical protein [Paenibacillus sp. P22]|uniref:hypothetical protein n=1 Tax=Paenibacillus sp. P22 TaxID=483908 RepID=UPI0012EDC58E|nr:hypothetical protein [Paenibacillus sp. P22]